MRTILGDGNFKQDHLAMKHDFDDVSLNDGLGYMVARKPFESYINYALTLKNDKEKPTVSILFADAMRTQYFRPH